MKVMKLVLLLLFIVSSLMCAEIGPFVFRVNAGAGYTFINLEKALGWDWENFEEWDYLNIKANIQCLFFHIERFSVGAEAGYNVLYYYYVRVPYVPSPLVYERTIAPVNLSAAGAFSLSDTISIVSSAGIYFFHNGIVPGFKGSLVFRLPITENIAMPFSLVGEVIFGSGTPVTAGATAGFVYTLNM